jgi:HK97 family phage portal protein
MNPISKIFNKTTSYIGGIIKAITLSDVRGGFDIHREFSWDSAFSQIKNLGYYEKSVYVYACVNKIAVKTASIDWSLLRIKNKVGDTTEIFVHDALDLLYKPNPFQTKAEFFEKFMINKKLAGEAYILKVRDDSGKVRELWNLRPDYMTVVKDKELYIKAYEFSVAGKLITFDPKDIIHDAYPNPIDEFGGMSPLFAASSRVETELVAVAFQRNFFKNNARPDFLLKTPGKLTNDQKEQQRASWDKKHKGEKNVGKGAFLEGGMEYQQVSISQREMDYIESLKMTRDDILTAFGVPKPIVAVTDDVNLANAKTAMEIFLSETIVPEIKRLTEKLNEDLIYPEYGDIFYIEYDDSFMPRNDKMTAEVRDIKIKNGTMLINEARELDGLDPLAGGWNLYMPLNMVAIGGLSKSTKAPTKSNMKTFRGRGKAIKFLEIREEIEREVYGAAKKIYAKEVAKSKTKSFILPEVRGAYYDTINKAIDAKGESFKPAIIKFMSGQEERALKKLNGQKSISTKDAGDLLDVKKEQKLFADISFPFLEDFLRTAGDEALDMIAPAEDFDMTDELTKYIKQRAEAMSKEVTRTTIEKISRTLAEGIEAGEGINLLGDRVKAVYQGFPDYRADMIARTEATAANNAGFIEGYKQSGVSNAKEWISTNDGRTRDTHVSADGEIVGLDESFSNGLEYPGDPNGGADETVNCRCVLAPAYRE